MFEIEEQQLEGELSLRVRGLCSAETVHGLRERLEATRRGHLRIDFSCVHSFRDSSLTLLLVVLQLHARHQPESSVFLHGLRQHQERLLGWLGATLDERGKVLLAEGDGALAA